MAEKPSVKGWTDTEKVGLFLQIISKSGAIPWPELTLPEGRTLKACQVMVDKEKQKVKKAREAAGEDADAESISPKKRKAAEVEGGKAKKGRKGKAAAEDGGDEDEGEATPAKKTKRTKKKSSKAQASEAADDMVKEEEVEDAE